MSTGGFFVPTRLFGEGSLGLVVFDFVSCVSPKIALPFGGQFFTAAAQSVGAGCCAAGTSFSQIRHMPLGGMYAAGISSCCGAGGVCCAPLVAAAATIRIPVSPRNFMLLRKAEQVPEF